MINGINYFICFPSDQVYSYVQAQEVLPLEPFVVVKGFYGATHPRLCIMF